MKVRKAVIPSAGLGTRFLPATKALPKEMLPIVDKPTIQFIVEEAKNLGYSSIMNYFEDQYMDIPECIVICRSSTFHDYPAFFLRFVVLY